MAGLESQELRLGPPLDPVTNAMWRLELLDLVEGNQRDQEALMALCAHDAQLLTEDAVEAILNRDEKTGIGQPPVPVQSGTFQSASLQQANSDRQKAEALLNAQGLTENVEVNQ